MVIWVALAFLLLLVIGLPIYVAMGLAGLLGVIIIDAPLTVPAGRMLGGIYSYTLIAIPMFILMGEVIYRTKIIDDIVGFLFLVVRRFRTALLDLNVISSMFFAGVSGSSASDISSIGRIIMPLMKPQYGNRLTAGITVSSGLIGVIIPPSIPMLVYAGAVEISVGQLFLSGVVPGLLLGLGYLVIGHIWAGRMPQGASSGEQWAETFKVTERSPLVLFLRFLPATFLPVMIIGGLIMGIFTATEAAAVGCAYVIIYGWLTRSLTLPILMEAAKESVRITGSIIVIIGSAYILTWTFIRGKLPDLIAETVPHITTDPTWLLVVFAVLILLLGCLIDPSPLIVMAAPILLPVALKYGIDPLQFALVFVICAVLGNLTPPVGILLFVTAKVGVIPPRDVIIGALPFLGYSLLVVLAIIFWPQLFLYLPSMIY